MNVRSTVILWIIAVVGVIAAVVVDRLAAGPGANGRAEAVAIFPAGVIDVDAIEAITLERESEPPLQFRRDGKRWTQARPFPFPMDAFSIRQLAQLTADLKGIPLAETGTPPSDSALGLDPPHAVLTLEGGGLTERLAIGRRGFAGRAYVRAVGLGEVYVVDQALYERAIEMDPKEWRDRTIFQDVGVDSDRIELISGDVHIVLARDRKRWMMEKPARTRVGELSRDELMQALGRARSGGFILDVPEDIARFGLDEPAGIISVTTSRVRERDGVIERTPEVQTLRIGARIGVGTQDRFGMIEGYPTIVRIGEAVLQALFRAPAALAAATASGAVPADVKSIRIDGIEGDFRLERDVDRWIAPDRGGREVEAAAVDGFLRALTAVHAPQVEFRPFPRDKQVAAVTLFDFAGKPMDTVRVARDEPAAEGAGERWILENGDSVLRVFTAMPDLGLTPAAYGLP